MRVQSFCRSASGLALVLLLGAVHAIALPRTADAQIWKKIGEKAKEAVGAEAARKTEALLEKAVRCAVDDARCVEQAKAEKKPVVLTDKDGKVLTDQSGAPLTSPQNARAIESAPDASPGEPIPAATKLELRAPDESWMKDTAVRVARDHFLSGSDLWSMETGQRVTKGFTKIEDPWLVARQPGMVLSEGMYPAAWGFTHALPYWHKGGEDYAAKPGAKSAGPTFELCLPPYACANHGIKSPGQGGGPFLSADYRRVIFFEAGDLWRADANWPAQTIENRHQVTQIGVLGNSSIQRWPTPVHWHGNTLFLKADLTKEKPILKVDLLSGAVEEMATLGVFEGGMFANPGGSRLCKRHGEILTCYEVRTGEVREIALPSGGGRLTGLFGDDPQWADTRLVRQTDTPEGTFWIDDETAVSFYNGFFPNDDQTALPAGIVRVDFRSGKAEILYQAGFADATKRRPETITRMVLLPDRRHVALDLTRAQAGQRKVRVSVEDGSAVTLSDVPVQGVWLDAEKYLFSRTEGSLAELGTFVHDVSAGSAKRICQAPAMAFPSRHRNGTPSAILFPERSVVYFETSQTPRLFRADLANGECRKLSEGSSRHDVRIGRLRTPPIDLRLDLSGDALWKASGAKAP